ncbi:MAG: hypothetical protein KAG96_05035 [Ichthyobacteriaceae bacterium]|nr:hypothetical protein [Ichthyobacteriaceae bacterium]
MSTEFSKENKDYSKSIENRDKAHKLKTLTFLFAALLVMSIAYILYAYHDHKEVTDFLKQEKAEVEMDLAQMENEYKAMTLDNDSLNTQLNFQTIRISEMRDSVKQMQASVYLLRKYKRMVRNLKAEKKQLFLLADSLDRMNQILIAQRDTVEQKLQKQTLRAEELEDKNQRLTQNVKKGSVLDIYNLKAEAVKIGWSGKITTTQRSRRATRIRVSMTLGRNRLSEIGEKTIHVRISTPEDKLMGVVAAGTKEFSIEGRKMDYSAKTRVHYEQQNLDVSVFVEGTEDEFVKGTYLVAVYAEGQFIGETEISLR